MDASLSESVVTFRASLQVVQEIQESGYPLPDIVDTYVGTLQNSIWRIERSSMLRTAAVPQRSAIAVQKRAVRNVLREVHARPLCTMARVMEDSMAGMVKLFHMPYDHLSDRNFLECMMALAKDAEQYRALFVKKGCPPDFLERFASAIDDFKALLNEQTLNQQYRVGARGAQYQSVREGKGALLYLDAILSPLLYDNPRLLAGWRQACFPNRKIGRVRNERLSPPKRMKELLPSLEQYTSDNPPASLPSGQLTGGIIRRLLGREAVTRR